MQNIFSTNSNDRWVGKFWTYLNMLCKISYWWKLSNCWTNSSGNSISCMSYKLSWKSKCLWIVEWVSLYWKAKVPKHVPFWLCGKGGNTSTFSAATYDFFRNIPFCIVEENTLHHIVLRWVAMKFEKQECFIKMAKKTKMCYFLL